MDAPTIEALRTVAGAAILTAVLVQLLLNTLTLAPATQDRIGPLIAVAVGIVVVEIATFTILTGPNRTDVLQGVVNGIFAGLASMGIHNVWTKTDVPAIAKSVVGTIKPGG